MGTPLQVLIVEDSEDDAKLMARELRKYRFEPNVQRVETAEAMKSALDRGGWDLVLADYRLPHFSGPQALEMVQKRGLDIPVILVSGAVGEEKAVAAMKAGAHDFVLKDSLVRLGAAVTRELREADERRQRRKAQAALRLLAEISKVLTDAPDYNAVLRGAVQLVVPTLADFCILYSSGEYSIVDIVEVAHVNEVDGELLQDFAQRYRPDYPPAPGERHPVAKALRLRRGVLTSEVTEADLSGMARDEAQQHLLERLGIQSMITLPLLVREELTGLWIFAFTGARRYTDADLTLAQVIGGRIALMAENARLSRAREEFISTAVHEIRTPVAAIKMAVQLMLETPPEQRESRLPDFFARLNRQSNRLARLVNDVLELSRVELHKVALRRRKTDLCALIEQVVHESRSLSASHQIMNTCRDRTTIEIDADRIEQVLLNLIQNAIKYSPAGGKIELATERRGDEIVVSVRDQGVGIAAERQARLFERFYRAHAGTPYDYATSLGVGLYLSRELVLRHNGRMWFESQEGKGSTFYFSLPLTSAPPEERSSKALHGQVESSQ